LLALDISRMFIVDYFLLATCQSRRHLLSLARDLCEWQSAPGFPSSRPEGGGESGWVLADLGDVIVHLFLPETRALYDLELLWGDAPRLDAKCLGLLEVTEAAKPLA
ncbi:MAG: ribosome silencing factor, partial [Planctomycetes bacterium]|nr:ribosome silencing factor [Planctomycetota bacterium]